MGARIGDAATKTASAQQSDALLWLAGAIIVGLGVTWLLLSQPWLGGDAPDAVVAEADLSGADAASNAIDRPATAASVVAAPSADGGQAGRADLETPLEQNPLRMAELAYEAGMLVEPEEYSAWTLYKRALDEDATSEAARAGLEKIADELLKRASVAVEQGRFDDALGTIERIRSAIPAHPGANDLAFRIDALRPAPEPEPEPEPEAERSVARAEPSAPARAAARSPTPSEPKEPDGDQLLAPHEGFVAALAQNNLLTPIDSSAKHFLNAMLEIDADHELTREAQGRLSEALLTRANAAIIELDQAAAETWLVEAERLGVNLASVADARERLRRRLIDAESAKRVPVSALVLEHYVAPSYPARALERSFNGWVDIEFTVGRDGSTRDVTVTDASHNSFFRREAIEAVEQWRFQPRIFMGEAIEQRAYTRIRFAFEG